MNMLFIYFNYLSLLSFSILPWTFRKFIEKEKPFLNQINQTQTLSFSLSDHEGFILIYTSGHLVENLIQLSSKNKLNLTSTLYQTNQTQILSFSLSDHEGSF